MSESELTKLTVNMTPTAMDALNETADRLGDTRTETLNRAIQLYAHVTALDVGVSVTYAVREGEPVTIARIKTPRAARRAIQEGS